ncbi:TRAP transporter substrate-binding protein DctP [Stappia stellulata]|uniref:TRAP transporter substrate-binding protein DctP n=1 Tax=Stappia stellulata TaxID=71235 RepID=UPI000401145F|nr:TRAP transporter substrate-binding protein DctP [Stappia stellulata]
MSVRLLVRCWARAARLGGLLLMMSIATAGTTRAETDTQLKAVTFLPPNSAFILPFQDLVATVNATAGAKSVRITLVGGPEAVSPFELGRAVALGAIEIGVLPVNYYRDLAVEAEALQLLPGRYHEIRDTPAWEILEVAHEKAGLKLLGVYGDTVPFFTYLVDPVETLDFTGLRLRVTPVYGAFYERLGATTVTLPPGELHAALSAGAVDGFGWPAWDVTTFGWDAFARHRIEPGFYKTAIAIVMNAGAWNGLTDAKRDALARSVAGFERNTSERMAETTRTELAKQEAAGMRVIDLGAGLVAQAETAYWEELGRRSPEAIAQLRAFAAD